ncbi:MAG TPA: dienelactone hydrolase family protein [Polyangiales bacterium]|nr:dienelactone hydrolase family protein [Polyangiales bacterium]
MNSHSVSAMSAGLLAVIFAACSSSEARLPNSSDTGGVPGAPAAGASAVGTTVPAATSGSGGVVASSGRGGATAGTSGVGGSGGSPSTSTVVAGMSGSSAGTGGAAAASGSAGTGGASAGTSGTEPALVTGSCETLPEVTDYTKAGPFDAKMFSNVGPGNNYTMYRPDTSLGKDGFKHPIATWGNGIATTPDEYQKLLSHIASHGFVIIACNDTQAERACLNAGMDWLVMQDAESGPLQGKLDTTREATIGYSWGGGAAIDTANRPNVKTTLSLHGMPPRETDAWSAMHAPLMLTTSTGDNFVTASGYVTPNYDNSKVQTFYGTLENASAGHLYIADSNSAICIGAVLGDTFGTCGDAKQEQGPAVAWLRLWVCGDQNAKSYFYGDDCTLCKSPWLKPQRKMWP